jgi:hypothetical protein
MHCEEFEKALEELDDYADLPSPLQAHRLACRPCAELVRDLTFIGVQARELLPLEQPPERVWAGIERQIEHSGLIKQPPRRRPSLRPAFGWFWRMGMGFSYATVFAVALGVVYVYSILSPPVPAPPLPQAPNPPFAQLFEKVPPKQREIYVSNLNQVNSSIQQLQTFLAEHPEDPFARDELFTTYQQKSRLWEDLVRWQDVTPEINPDVTGDTAH